MTRLTPPPSSRRAGELKVLKGTFGQEAERHRLQIGQYLKANVPSVAPDSTSCLVYCIRVKEYPGHNSRDISQARVHRLRAVGPLHGNT